MLHFSCTRFPPWLLAIGSKACEFLFAKDCLLTGQEQTCSRITQLFGCLVGCDHAENG